MKALNLFSGVLLPLMLAAACATAPSGPSTVEVSPTPTVSPCPPLPLTGVCMD